MNKTPYLYVILVAFLSIVIQFLFIYSGYDNGGLAMAPFVYIPFMAVLCTVIIVFNLFYTGIKKKHISINNNILIFLAINILLFVKNSINNYGFKVFESLKDDGMILMIYPSIISSLLILLILYFRKR